MGWGDNVGCRFQVTCQMSLPELSLLHVIPKLLMSRLESRVVSLICSYRSISTMLPCRIKGQTPMSGGVSEGSESR